MADGDELNRLRRFRDRVAAVLRAERDGESRSAADLLQTLSEAAAASYPRTSNLGPGACDLGPDMCHLEDTDEVARDSFDARMGQSASSGNGGRMGQRRRLARDRASQLSIQEQADLDRSLREATDPPVLWFTVRGYRCSFDLRADASRFIVLRGPGVLLAQGLLTDRECLVDNDTGQLPDSFRTLFDGNSCVCGRERGSTYGGERLDDGRGDDDDHQAYEHVLRRRARLLR